MTIWPGGFDESQKDAQGLFLEANPATRPAQLARFGIDLKNSEADLFRLFRSFAHIAQGPHEGSRA